MNSSQVQLAMKTEEFDLFLRELLGADMSMNETAKNYGLPDVIASLCKSGSTGRLQINAGSTRGAFFFKDGQLVDARVGTLIGFAAVNLAVSSGAIVLNFDSSIEPPAPRFTDPNERRLLKTRFGIDTAGAEVQSAQRSGGERRLSLVAQASAVPPWLQPPAKTEIPVPTASGAPLDDAGVVPSYASTQLKNATAPLNVAPTPLIPPPAATAPQRDASVPAQETIVPLNVASTSSNLTTAALRDTVVPLKTAGPRPRSAIAAKHEAVVPMNAVGTPPQTATASLRNVTALLKDISVLLVAEREAIFSLSESAKKALTSLLSPQTLSLVKTHAKASSLAVQKKLASVWQSLQALDKQSVSYVRNKKTAVRAASIALILILAAVGFASYWSKGKETLPLEFSPPPAASSLRIPAVAPPKTPRPSKTLSDEQRITTKPLTKVPSEAVRVRQDSPPTSETTIRQLRATGSAADTNKTISRETVADGTSETKESGTAEVATSQTHEEKQLAKPSSRGIAVEVRVEGGRVSEAFIKNPRPGLEAYEATALRLARQRRYSKETTTTQTLVFQVNGEH